jgi:hypothetical protein
VWVFYLGKTKDGIIIPDLAVHCQELLDSGQFFWGHAKFQNVYHTRNQASLTACVLRHVSAHGLQSLLAPTSLKAHS